MATQSDWRFRVEGNVVVGEFPEGTKLTGPESDKMVERFGELIARPGTDAHVTILRSNEPYSREGQENLEKSALAGVDHGITRWAIVATGTKAMTMSSRVDVDGVEAVETFDDADEAIAWAKD